MKEKIAKWLFEWGYEFEDFGAETYDEKDDYTKYAAEVASLVSRSSFASDVVVSDKKASADKGILLCGSGVGVDVVANKFDGVRASIGIDSEQVRQGRSDDNMNILVIAADHTSEHDAKEMVKMFLETGFSGKTRYKKRLQDIKNIEANN